MLYSGQKKGYGHNKIIGIKYNTLTGKYYPSRECEIDLGKELTNELLGETNN